MIDGCHSHCDDWNAPHAFETSLLGSQPWHVILLNFESLSWDAARPGGRDSQVDFTVFETTSPALSTFTIQPNTNNFLEIAVLNIYRTSIQNTIHIQKSSKLHYLPFLHAITPLPPYSGRNNHTARKGTLSSASSCLLFLCLE